MGKAMLSKEQLAGDSSGCIHIVLRTVWHTQIGQGIIGNQESERIFQRVFVRAIPKFHKLCTHGRSPHIYDRCGRSGSIVDCSELGLPQSLAQWAYPVDFHVTYHVASAELCHVKSGVITGKFIKNRR